MKAFYIYCSGNQENLSAESRDFVFVNSGFSFKAFFFSQFWLIFHRMWYFLCLTIPLQILLYQASTILSFPESGLLQLIFPLSLGFLAHSIREAHLKRKGYKLYTIVMAENSEAAQLKFFEGVSLY